MRSPVGTLIRAATRTRKTESPVPYAGRTTSHARMPFLDRRDREQQLRAMESVGTLHAIIGRLATETACVKWRLYRKATSGKDEDRTEVTSHAALDLWNKPNHWWHGELFREASQQHLDLVGEAWWVVVRHPRVRSIPLELWPVRPDRMQPIPHPQKYLTGYVYWGPDGEQVPLELDEVIQIRRPHPRDPYRGTGPVQALLADVDAARFSAEWNRNFFLNSAMPGGIVQVDHRLDDPEFQEMVERWREQHQGVANAHRVAILERAQWVDRSYSLRDMQFQELRMVQREIIREAFAFPKSELGTMDDVNRATAEAGRTILARGHIAPRLERYRAALNHHLLPMFGPTAEGLEFDFDSPVPEDREADNAERESKATAYKILTDARVVPEDAAEVAGLPPMRTIEPAASSSALPAAPESPADRALRQLAARVVAQEGERLPQEDLPDIGPVREEYLRALDDLMASWNAEVQPAWNSALVSEVQRAVQSGDRTAVADVQVPQEQIDAATALLLAAMLALAAAAAAGVVAEAAEQGVTIVVGAPSEALLEELARIVVTGLAKELALAAGREAVRLMPPTDPDPATVADGVRQHLDGLTDARRRQTLGDALHQAQHAGRTATMRQAEDELGVGVTLAYYGQEMNDLRTCGPCRDVDGRWLGNSIAEALAEYPTGGYIACLGGPRCRGHIVAVFQQVGDDA